MNTEMRINEERDRLPQLYDWSPDEDEQIAEVGQEADDRGLHYLAHLPTPSPALTAAWTDSASYGEWRAVNLPSRDVSIFCFATVESRDQFCADVGATKVRDLEPNTETQAAMQEIKDGELPKYDSLAGWKESFEDHNPSGTENPENDTSMTSVNDTMS